MKTSCSEVKSITKRQVCVRNLERVIHRDEVEWGRPGAGEGRRVVWFKEDRVQSCKMKGVPEIGHTTVGIHLSLLNCTLKNGESSDCYVTCTLPQ